MFRKSVLKKYIPEKIEKIIGHEGGLFLPSMFLNALILVGLYLLFSLVNYLRTFKYTSWLFGIFGIFFLIRYTIHFLDDYLDSLVITERGLVLFRRDGILERKMEIFDRARIDMISFEQNGLADKILFRGDIVISIDGSASFVFESVYNPKKQVSALLSAKHRYSFAESSKEEKTELDDQEKFNILVETLGEVIKDYMGRKDSGNM